MKSFKRIIITCALGCLNLYPLFAFGYPVHDFTSLMRNIFQWSEETKQYATQVKTWVEEYERWKIQLDQIKRYYEELESGISSIDWDNLSSIWDGLNSAFGSMYDIETKIAEMDKDVQKKVAIAKQNVEKAKEEQLTKEEKAYSNLLSDLTKKYDTENPSLSRAEKLAKEMHLYEEMVQTIQKEADDMLKHIKDDYAYEGDVNSNTALYNGYSGYKSALKHYAEASYHNSRTIFMGAKEPQEYKEMDFYLKEVDDEKWIAPYVSKTIDRSKYKAYEGVRLSPASLIDGANTIRENKGIPIDGNKCNFSALVQMATSARAGYTYNDDKNVYVPLNKKTINNATKEDLEAMVEEFKNKQANANHSAETARTAQQHNEELLMSARMTLKTKIQTYEDTLKNLEIAKKNLEEFTKQYEEHMDLEKVRKNIDNIDDNIHDVEVKG